jgi:hypothetical protein
MSITWHFMTTNDHVSAINISLCTIFVMCPILHNYCICGQLCVDYGDEGPC